MRAATGPLQQVVDEEAQMDENGRLRWVVVLTAVGSFMAALDTLVVASALSTIRQDLGASLTDLEWTVNAYNLSFAVLLVPAAVLGDRLGRARTYAAGLGLFALASAGCAMAGSVGALVAMRVVQGAGAAVVMTLGLALLTSAFPPEKRGAAVGLFSAVTGLAVASGPLVGGAVVDGLAWQWIFWLNVPVGLLAAPLALRLIPEVRVPDSRLDVPGVALLAGGVLGLVWTLVRGESAGWASGEVLGAAAVGLLLLAGFAVWEGRATYPLLPPRLLRVRGFAAGNAAIFLTFAALFSAVFFYGQLLQIVMAQSPLGAGVRLMAWTGTFLVFAPAAGALADRIGERPLLTTGLTVQAAATVASVTSALARARGSVRAVLPERSQQEVLREVGDRQVRATVAAFMAAWERNDVGAVVALLADDVEMTMPPYASGTGAGLRSRLSSPRCRWPSGVAGGPSRQWRTASPPSPSAPGTTRSGLS